jgi:hypothetical protein
MNLNDTMLNTITPNVSTKNGIMLGVMRLIVEAPTKVNRVQSFASYQKNVAATKKTNFILRLGGVRESIGKFTFLQPGPI